MGIDQADEHQHWMARALDVARQAQEIGEVPVGAIVVIDNEVVAEGFNRVITDNDPTAHAEIVALKNAGERIGNYRLIDASVYITLEPCCMCSGALIHARVKQVIYGASDYKTGAAGSVFNVLNSESHNHHPEIIAGVMSEQCGALLSSFFRMRREAHKKARQ